MKVNSARRGMLERYGSALAPAGEISSVDTLSPVFSSTGRSTVSGIGSRSGSAETPGPRSSSTREASSGGSGGSSIAVLTGSARSVATAGYESPVSAAQSRGSVMTPFSAEAVAVSGEQSHTASSWVPERPGKLRGNVRSELRPTKPAPGPYRYTPGSPPGGSGPPPRSGRRPRRNG